MLIDMYQNSDRGFHYRKLCQFNIPDFFAIIQICFLLANTNITVVNSRLGSVSRKSDVNGAFNVS